MADWVGFAAVLPAQAVNAGLPSAASIFTAKIYAIKTAFEELVANHSKHGNYTIFSLSKCIASLQVKQS